MEHFQTPHTNPTVRSTTWASCSPTRFISNSERGNMHVNEKIRDQRNRRLLGSSIKVCQIPRLINWSYTTVRRQTMKLWWCKRSGFQLPSTLFPWWPHPYLLLHLFPSHLPLEAHSLACGTCKPISKSTPKQTQSSSTSSVHIQWTGRINH